ncbi:MAG: TolC family protein [Flavobacteriaceae bacterium]|nr:TolC family protein [Flavobacteriaceae bacterium]
MKRIKFYIIVSFLCVYGINAQEKQQLTEQQAIDLALKKSVELNSAKLNIQTQQANVGGAFELEPLSLEYRKVQVNPTTKVREMGVSQNFGSILGHIKRRQLAKSEVELATANAKITEKQTIKQVRSLYQQWHYLYALKTLLEQQQKNVNKIKTITEKMYESGEIGGLENDVTVLKSLNIQTQKSTIYKEFTQVENQLKALLQLQKNIQPQEEFPRPLAFAFSDKSSDIFSDAIAKSNKVASRGVSLAKSVYFPQISAGLIKRKAGKAKDFMGFVVGLQIPLPFGSNRANVKKQRILQQEIAFNNEAKQIEIDNTKASLSEQLTALKSEIDTISKTFEKAKKFIKKLSIAYKAGEIGTYEYSQSFDTYFEVMQNYLALINTYNQMVVEYEFYVN